MTDKFIKNNAILHKKLWDEAFSQGYKKGYEAKNIELEKFEKIMKLILDMDFTCQFCKERDKAIR